MPEIAGFYGSLIMELYQKPVLDTSHRSNPAGVSNASTLRLESFQHFRSFELASHLFQCQRQSYIAYKDIIPQVETYNLSYSSLKLVKLHHDRIMKIERTIYAMVLKNMQDFILSKRNIKGRQVSMLLSTSFRPFPKCRSREVFLDDC